MKTTILALLLLSPAAVNAIDWDFDDAVAEFEQHYQTRRMKIPFLGLANFAGSLVGVPFGVQDLHLAIFENVRTSGRDPFAGRVPAGWRPLLRVRERNGESVVIFGRDEDSWVRMLVLTLERDGGDATMVQFKLRPTELLRFVAGRARTHAGDGE